MKMLRSVSATFLAACSLAAGAAIPNEISAEYRLTTNGITVGRVNESFSRKGDSYSIQSVSRSEGALKAIYDEQITMQSAGRVRASGLQPIRFDEKRTRDSKRDVTATFDWQRGVMLSRFRGEESEIALPAQTQDRLSMMYQFMHAPVRSGNVVLNMSNGRKVESYVYRFVEETRISTPAGEFDTLHFERVTEGAKDSRVEVWLAKDRSHFPVRVAFDDPKGLRLEQSLVSLETR